MDLENRNASLLEELSSTTPLSRRSASLTDWLPRAPARHSLSGHRSPITKVSFHPLYSVLATASEDASVKIWDWESGELERTVKGHTKAVMDVEFDKKGEMMGELDRFVLPLLLHPTEEIELTLRFSRRHLLLLSCSNLLLGPHHQTLGYDERVQERQDPLRTRSLRLECEVPTSRRLHRFS